MYVPLKGGRPSNFDLRAPDGVELPPIGVITTADGVPNSFYSYMNQVNSNSNLSLTLPHLYLLTLT